MSYVHAIGAVASRDGKHLYYTRRNKLFNAYNNLDFPALAGRRGATGRRATRTRSPSAQGSALPARCSRPTGRSSSTARGSTTRPGCGSAISRRGEERWLKLPVQRDEQESRYTRDLIPGYAFTPDGKSVLAAYGGKIHRIDAPDRRGRGDPVLGAGVAAGRLAAELPDPGGRRPGAGAADPGARAVARRQAAGVLGPDAAVH